MLTSMSTIEVTNSDGKTRVIADTPESRAKYEAVGFAAAVPEPSKPKTKSKNTADKSDEEN